MRYAYPCLIERDIEEQQLSGREAYVITFRDVPEAISGGWSWAEALEVAQDCLDVALTFYSDEGHDLPPPSELRSGEVMISITPTVAAKFALYNAMREQGINATELAERLELDEQAIEKLLNPLYRSHITTVRRALAVVGRELIVEDCAVASPPESISVATAGQRLR